jgi:endonuclease-3
MSHEPAPEVTRERALEIDARLKDLYPAARIALDFASDFQLLIAVILSAQTTDVSVNKFSNR